MEEIKYQLLRRDINALVDKVSENYWESRDMHLAAKIAQNYTRQEELNRAIDEAVENWIERPCKVEYTANFRFLLLVCAYRRYQALNAEKKRLYQLEREFYGEVIAELLAVKTRYERSNDEKSEDYRSFVRDGNGDELDVRLLDLAFACFDAKNWEPFDDWRKSDLYSFAVVAVG